MNWAENGQETKTFRFRRTMRPNKMFLDVYRIFEPRFFDFLPKLLMYVTCRFMKIGELKSSKRSNILKVKQFLSFGPAYLIWLYRIQYSVGESKESLKKTNQEPCYFFENLLCHRYWKWRLAEIVNDADS